MSSIEEIRGKIHYRGDSAVLAKDGEEWLLVFDVGPVGTITQRDFAAARQFFEDVQKVRDGEEITVRGKRGSFDNRQVFLLEREES